MAYNLISIITIISASLISHQAQFRVAMSSNQRHFHYTNQGAKQEETIKDFHIQKNSLWQTKLPLSGEEALARNQIQCSMLYGWCQEWRQVMLKEFNQSKTKISSNKPMASSRIWPFSVVIITMMSYIVFFH